MPELPEVETIRLELEKYLLKHRIEKVEVRFRKTFKEGEGKLIGGKIIKVRRFAKALCIDLNNGYSALMHLKMTGQLIYRGPNLKKPPSLSEKVVGGIPGKHTHVVFHLDRKGKLYFNDYRKFGWVRVLKTEEVIKETFIQNLGPEPFKDLNFPKFIEIIKKYKSPIKLILMDQTKISGLGNIYANEALYLANIHPKTLTSNLSQKDTNNLYNSIIKVLKLGLKYQGTSDMAYVTLEGEEGTYQNHFLVYGRKDKLCQKCKKAKIEKIKLGGRGTYFCSNCQKT